MFLFEQDVKQAVIEDMVVFGKKAGLMSFEQASNPYRCMFL